MAELICKYYEVCYNINIMPGTTEKLLAVVELIIEQRFKSNSNIFKYDFFLVKDKLKAPADSDKYGMNSKEQRELLEQLDTDGIIQMDYVEETQDATTTLIRWKHGYTWLQEALEPCYEARRYPHDVFLNVSYDDIENLKYKYNLKAYPARLNYNHNSGRFTVICNGKKYETIRPLSYEKDSTRIIEYAWRHSNNYVTKDEINQSAKLDNPIKSIRESIKNCSTINNVLSPFVEYTNNKIKIAEHGVTLTKKELQTISSRSTIKTDI